MSRGGPGSNQLVRNYMTLRKAIGWIGILLPFVVFLGNWIIFSHHVAGCLAPTGNKLPDSLSGYYYSHMRDVFVGGMWAAGVFLFFYTGHDTFARVATNVAGLAAIGIALFPTMPPTDEFLQTNICGPVTAIVLQPAPHGSAIGIVHVACLCGLMLMIALMAWRFTRQYTDEQIARMTDDDREIEENQNLKRRNNRIYWGCVAALVAAGAFAVIQEFAFTGPIKSEAPWLLYAETVAFLAFGTAWFVKGRALLGIGNTYRTARSALTGARRPVVRELAGVGLPGATPGPAASPSAGPGGPDLEL
jgi:hypothetical protein